MTPPPTSIDGTDITGATIDGTDVTEITVDGQTVFTAGPPQGTVDNFESVLYGDQNKTLSDYYTGDVSNFTRQNSIVAEGNTALEIPTEFRDIQSNGTLPNQITVGDTVQVFIRGDGSDSSTFFAFMADGTGSNPGQPNNGYCFRLRFRFGPSWAIVERAGGSTVNDDVAGSPNVGEWYRFVGGYNGTEVTCDVFDLNDNLQTSLSMIPNNDFSSNTKIHFGLSAFGGPSYFDGVQIL